MAFCVPSAFTPNLSENYIVPWANPYTAAEFVNPSPLLPPTGTISGITITNLTTTGFTVTLNPVERATAYYFTWGSFSVSTSTPSGIFTGLPPATTEDLAIAASNEDGVITSTPQPVTTLTPPPSVPTGLSASGISSTAFTLDWSPAEYASSYSATWGSYPAASIVGTQATFSSLPSAFTYDCIVTATNSSGSVQSAPFPVATKVPVPAAPSGLNSYSVTSNSFQSSWTPVPYADSYTALWGSTPGVVSFNTASFSGLPVLTTSNLVVTASNASGTTSSSNFPITTGYPYPAAPTGLTAYSISSSSFDCSWSAVPYAVSYTALWGSTAGDVSGTTASFTGLPTAVTSNLVVSAVNPAGSAASLPLAVTTSNVPPAAPTGLATTTRGVDYFAATWTNVPGVTYSATVNGSSSNVTVSSNTVACIGLTPSSTSNSLIVTATNAGGSTPSDPLLVDLTSPRTFSFTGGLSDPPFPGASSTGLITSWTVPSDFDSARNPQMSNFDFISPFGSKVYYDDTVTGGTAMSYYMTKVGYTGNSYTFLTVQGGGGIDDNSINWTTSNAWDLNANDTWDFEYLVGAGNEMLLGTNILFQFTYNTVESP